MLRSARRARLEAWPQARNCHHLVARVAPLAMLRDGRFAASSARGRETMFGDEVRRQLFGDVPRRHHAAIKARRPMIGSEPHAEERPKGASRSMAAGSKLPRLMATVAPLAMLRDGRHSASKTRV